jgi:hypothetical protein
MKPHIKQNLIDLTVVLTLIAMGLWFGGLFIVDARP